MRRLLTLVALSGLLTACGRSVVSAPVGQTTPAAKPVIASKATPVLPKHLVVYRVATDVVNAETVYTIEARTELSLFGLSQLVLRTPAGTDANPYPAITAWTFNKTAMPMDRTSLTALAELMDGADLSHVHDVWIQLQRMWFGFAQAGVHAAANAVPGKR